MEVTPIFSEFLAIENYSDKIDLVKIKNEIYDYVNKEAEGNVLSNVGGYQSKQLDLQLIETYYPELKKMLDQFKFDINKLIKKDDYLTLTNVWININKSGNYNNLHVHPNSIISGSFYVSIPKKIKDGEAQIEFTRSREFSDFSMENHLSNMDDIFKWQSMWYRPKNSDLVLFPSYILHRVAAHFSDEDRISIAFNSQVKKI
jgi:uncharacterized protein (TIGR02466 family)